MEYLRDFLLSFVALSGYILVKIFLENSTVLVLRLLQRQS